MVESKGLDPRIAGESKSKESRKEKKAKTKSNGVQLAE